MITKEQLRDALTALGVRSGSKIIVHSAFSKLKTLEGGPETFCRVLMELVGVDGLILMPTFTFGLYEGAQRGEPFDWVNTPSDCGILTETFRKLPGVLRSIEPCHAVAAWGRDAFEFVRHHHQVPTVSELSPIGLLEKAGGVCLSIAADDAVTFMHVVEYTNHVPCLGCRSEEYPAILKNGRRVKLRTWGWRKGHCSALNTPEIFKTMAGQGALRKAALGEAVLNCFPLTAYRKAYEARMACCKTCPVRPRVVSNTVPGDWDEARHCLLPSTAFTEDTALTDHIWEG